MDLPRLTDPKCASADPEIFFPEDTGNRELFLVAKKICDSCPDINPCLEYALANPGEQGIWGGTSQRMRERIRTRRRKAGNV